MTKDDERREYRRYPVKLTVQMDWRERQFKLNTGDLSMGGIFLVTDEEIGAAGDIVQFAFRLPGGDAPGADAEASSEDTVRVAGRVMHAVGGRGVGIQFEWDEDSLADKLMLEEFFERAGTGDDAFLHSPAGGYLSEAVKDEDG